MITIGSSHNHHPDDYMFKRQSTPGDLEKTLPPIHTWHDFKYEVIAWVVTIGVLICLF